ncbi:hypothetical protein [Clostridium uliginosum]|uniref:Uncharacterized protein n=1 Tax=Clostridium uliginosum TaxID=119641 RepID=A0A1I1M2I0_9CLOT|nr:hypothetical protein [Clostridium uliginosum]SFC75870.1 hypothetical protein SAMN05421842_1098 [Clostridium uliginosum]
MGIIMLISFYLLFLIFMGAFIVCAITGSRILEKKSEAVAIYLFGMIVYGILTVVAFNLQSRMPIVTTNTTINSKPFSINKESSMKDNQAQVEDNTNDKDGSIIGDTDSKIYHVPGSTYYQKELKKKSNNEYFNTIQEAEKAGYRAPKK